ncbi:uncharacterized protein BN788_01469 [[Eubacterium] siraeum CAG:80]|uniref:Uncharacterized protein n=1 Tax=[Eubacterium] siraeum CAG:80 TaxID=1263080 RepID=R6SCK9_9FIRM|nr:uncharacterized protein BN788_01469 [[Eubacterium] siraeum CAG:80]
MKTAAQVFIIIGMVCGFWVILPLIFGGIALSQMSKGQRPSTGISVCVLLFCNMIGGILLLCAKDEDFYKPGTNNGYNPNMNNGYNPNMNNGYNANMNNNAYNPNANTGYSNANYVAPVNNTTADTTNNNFNNNGIQQ